MEFKDIIVIGAFSLGIVPFAITFLIALSLIAWLPALRSIFIVIGSLVVVSGIALIIYANQFKEFEGIIKMGIGFWLAGGGLALLIVSMFNRFVFFKAKAVGWISIILSIVTILRYYTAIRSLLFMGYRHLALYLYIFELVQNIMPLLFAVLLLAHGLSLLLSKPQARIIALGYIYGQFFLFILNSLFIILIRRTFEIYSSLTWILTHAVSFQLMYAFILLIYIKKNPAVSQQSGAAYVAQSAPSADP